MIGAHNMKLMLMNRGIRSAVISNLRRARTGHDLVRGAEDAATTGRTVAAAMITCGVAL
jgi:hypothetical protein